MSKIAGSKLYQIIFSLIIIISSNNLSFSQQRADDFEIYKKIDSIMSNAINLQAFPGAVLFAAKNDSLIFSKSYGYHTYDSLIKLKENHVFDLASITKILGATLSLMKMYELGYYQLDDPIRIYFKDFRWNKRGKATFREILAHQSGWQSWIRYYEEFQKKNGEWKSKYITEKPDKKHQLKITDSLYARTDIYRKIKKLIKSSDFNPDQGYIYSGLFFYLVPEFVEKMTDTSYVDYLKYHFYRPLELNSLTFNPLDSTPDSLIVPTEIDTFFRNQPLHGVVHDEGAVFMNGISGNAGLFSNASDILKLSIMLENYGSVDSLRFLQEETVILFTTTQYPNHENRRALGFDKPLLEYDSIKSSVSKNVSKLSFGHSGYTGSLLWIDPEKNLIFIFLSNRVYPDRTYRNIYELNVRPQIHDLIYELTDY
jgi:CubicO group peptidase (beta-lactamase class C family)